VPAVDFKFGESAPRVGGNEACANSHGGSGMALIAGFGAVVLRLRFGFTEPNRC
jgi:hypothetical protein